MNALLTAVPTAVRDTSGAEAVLFWVLAPLMVVAALGLLFAKKAVHAALGVAIVMVSLGVFYLAQDADFLGIIQVFVYTGAVMMLFLFVLMLVGVDSSDSLVETIKGQRWAGLALAIEPMVTIGDPATAELDDGWTVVTKDGSRAAHFEHTVAITPGGPEILTTLDSPPIR